MRNFDFYSPTYFVFGKDREAETGRYVKRFGGSRVLVVYGGQSAKRSGLLDRIMACLKEENLYAVELGGVKPNPRSGLVYEGIELCRREKIDFVLAVGGGSVIDTAKAIAIGVPYDAAEKRRGGRLPPALLLRAGPCPHGKPARLSDGLRHHGHHGPHL